MIQPKAHIFSPDISPINVLVALASHARKKQPIDEVFIHPLNEKERKERDEFTKIVSTRNEAFRFLQREFRKGSFRIYKIGHITLDIEFKLNSKIDVTGYDARFGKGEAKRALHHYITSNRPEERLDPCDSSTLKEFQEDVKRVNLFAGFILH